MKKYSKFIFLEAKIHFSAPCPQEYIVSFYGGMAASKTEGVLTFTTSALTMDKYFKQLYIKKPNPSL